MTYTMSSETLNSTIPHHTVCGRPILNGDISNDLDGPLTRYFWSRISEKRRVLKTQLLFHTNRKLYLWNGTMFGDLDWPVNASRGFVSISWASYWDYSRALPLLSVFRPKISYSIRVRGPLPVRFSQPCVVLENHSGGATRLRKKFDDIFICFDTMPACDRQTHDESNSRAMHSVARVKKAVVTIYNANSTAARLLCNGATSMRLPFDTRSRTLAWSRASGATVVSQL